MKTTEQNLKHIAVALLILLCVGYMVKCAFDCKTAVNTLTEMRLNETPNYQIY